MKYSMLILVILLVGFTTAEAKTNSNYLKERWVDLQQGSRSGELTKREVTVLKRELKAYRNTLRDFKSNDKLSRREKRKLRKLESLIDKQFYVALNNRETTRFSKRNKFKKRKAQARRGSYNNGLNCRPNTRRTGRVFQ